MFCKIRYVIKEATYYVFTYTNGDFGNNCETYNTEKAAFNDFNNRLEKFTGSIQYHVSENIKLSKIS